MIRAKELGGRTVVDVDAAEKLGRVDRIVLDPESRRVAGFGISRGSSIFKNDEEIFLPASCVHAVGPDAITVHRTGDFVEGLDGLPRVSDIAGRKVVSESGRLMGTVDDVLIDETDGSIIGYALENRGIESKVRDLVSNEPGDERPAFLRADANLRAGRDLIVAPDDAVSYDWDAVAAPQRPIATAATPAPWKPAGPVSAASAQWLNTPGSLETLDKKGQA